MFDDFLINAALDRLAKKDLSPEEREMLSKQMNIAPEELDKYLIAMREALQNPEAKEQMKAMIKAQAAGQSAPGVFDRLKKAFGKKD